MRFHLALRTFLSDTGAKGSEFVRRIRQVGSDRGVKVLFAAERGKGSHGTLYFGTNLVRNLRDELKTGTLHAMLKQLGLTLTDIQG